MENRLETVVSERFADRHDLLAGEATAVRAEVAEDHVISMGEPGRTTVGFPEPFVPNADLAYQVEIVDGSTC
jgi:hypothetical protein